MASSVELFGEFRDFSDTLIETGTWYGDGINAAFEAGYQKVYSCDINQEKIDMANEKFADKNLTTLCKSSESALEKFLSEIDEPVVIFLDAHAMPKQELREDLGFGECTLGDGPTSPLMQEIDVIGKHKIKNHTVLIDDIQCFKTWMFDGLTFGEVVEKMKSINEKYVYDTFDNVACFWVGERGKK